MTSYKQLPVRDTKLSCFGAFDNRKRACQNCIDWEECMGVKSSRSRTEMDGIQIAKAQDFHTWNGKIRIYLTKNNSHQCVIQVPLSIVCFLKLKHNDTIQVAIRKGEGQK